MTAKSLPTIFDELRSTFRTGRTRDLEWRQTQLQRLKKLVEDNETEIFKALHADLGKSAAEAFLSETSNSLAEINFALDNLPNWIRPQKVSTPLINQPGHSEIRHDPLGVVLIMAPWNYPFYLVVAPLVGAIAAGNCVVVKPSELAPKTSRLIAGLFSRYLDPQAILVIQGGVETGQALLEQPFDHIFFTGSARVGKIVMTAAAQNLSSVTLELGGKNPCIVCADTNLDVTARRIAWGKFLNAGQTCVAPDYVLADQSIFTPLIERLAAHIQMFYGEEPQTSPDYGRIVDDRHFARLAKLLEQGNIETGGAFDAEDRYIAPTVLTRIGPDSSLMKEEIFGPLLPVIPFSDFDEIFAHINSISNPLALYAFCEDADMQARILDQTSSGGVCFNDVIMQLTIPNLPFGGVGSSGMGAYHGKSSFLAFSHARSVLSRSEHLDFDLRYPPYTASKMRWLRRLLRT